MLDSDCSQGAKNQDQQQLCIGDGTLHDECTDMKEFSELIARVPTKVLWSELLTHQQRMFATALWEACNYGGKPKPGDLQHMEQKRDYAEWVLRMDHRRQWNNFKKTLSYGEIRSSS